jgi:hypothetical protein
VCGRNKNHIEISILRVRGFILNGAPIKSISYADRQKARESKTHHRLTSEMPR